MENIYLIVAYVLGTRAIGINGKLLWENLKDDMLNFVAITKGGVLIVGRKTNDTFTKQLPGRDIIIITRDQNYKPLYEVKDPSKIHLCSSAKEALALAKKIADGERKIFVIGGEEIYRIFLTTNSLLPQTLVITEVRAKGLEADTFFPELPVDQYDEISSVPFEKEDGRNDYSFTIKTLRFSNFSA